MGEAMQYMVAEIGQQLERYVPRIRVRDISFSSNDTVDGQLIPRVTVGDQGGVPWRFPVASICAPCLP